MPLLPTPSPSSMLRGAALAVAIARVVRGASRAAALHAADRSPAASAPVTIVVPARNEGDRIGPCIRSLAGRAPVLVIDDGSTDHTADVARAEGARVIDAGPLPPGWAGKAHALQVGLEAADTDIVLALDADCRADAGLVEAMAGAVAGHTMVSAGVRVVADDLGGRLVHASMLASLVYRLGPPGVAARRPERTLANGQCMAFDRAAVLAAGGFAPVADNLIEDVALARHLAASGHRVAFLDATSLVSVEGYGSARDTWDGWGRSLSLAEVTSPSWLLADIGIVWLAMAAPIPRLATGRGDVLDIGALTLRFGVIAATAGAFEQRGPALTLAPLADVAVASRLTLGAIRPSRTWRGRTYD